MRDKISMTSDVMVFRLCETITVFHGESYDGTSLREAVTQVIQRGDCGHVTHVIVDGKDHGCLASLGFEQELNIATLKSGETFKKAN